MIKIAHKLLALSFLLIFSNWALSAQMQRLRVPDYFNCDRNLVTSWSGIVVNYQRNGGLLHLKIHTDADTFEQLIIDQQHIEALVQQFYLHNKSFQHGDWAKIESSPGQLYPNMAATVWLCADENIGPLLNWQPPNK